LEADVRWLRFLIVKLVVAACLAAATYFTYGRCDWREVPTRLVFFWGHTTALTLHGRYLFTYQMINMPPEAPYFDVVRDPFNGKPPYLKTRSRPGSLTVSDMLPYAWKGAVVLGLLLPPWRPKRRKATTDSGFEVSPPSNVACDRKQSTERVASFRPR
jgi:hypothetical protein